MLVSVTTFFQILDQTKVLRRDSMPPTAPSLLFPSVLKFISYSLIRSVQGFVNLRLQHIALRVVDAIYRLDLIAANSKNAYVETVH